MVILPKEKPVVENLNSYYVNLQRLLEHFQGEVGSGGIHLKSPSAEGVIFFDRDAILDGIYENKQERLSGAKAVDRLLASSAEDNYAVGIYRIDPEQIYFWTSIPDAVRTYEDLSTEFTNLEGLIKKMGSEKLSGYIKVFLENEGERGLIFFREGLVIGGSYSWKGGGLSPSKEEMDLLIRKTTQSGGTLHVSRIAAKGDGGRRGLGEKGRPLLIRCLEELLGSFESLMRSQKSSKTDFNTLMKRKFLDLADQYAFLDPFSGEFEYSNHKIRFSGEAREEELAEGLLVSVKGLAREVGVEPQVQGMLDTWFQKHEKKLSGLGIRV